MAHNLTKEIKLKLIDVSDHVKKDVEFGTCELCFCVEDLEYRTYHVMTSLSDHVYELDNGDLDFQYEFFPYVLFDEEINLIEFAHWLNQQAFTLDLSDDECVSGIVDDRKVSKIFFEALNDFKQLPTDKESDDLTYTHDEDSEGKFFNKLFIMREDSDGTLEFLGELYEGSQLEETYGCRYGYNMRGMDGEWENPPPSEKLPHFFAKRLPDKRRNDYADLMRSLGLPADASDMQILAKTEGRIMADNIRLLTFEKFVNLRTVYKRN